MHTGENIMDKEELDRFIDFVKILHELKLSLTPKSKNTV